MARDVVVLRPGHLQREGIVRPGVEVGEPEALGVLVRDSSRVTMVRILGRNVVAARWLIGFVNGPTACAHLKTGTFVFRAGRIDAML